jgi:phospholipase/lecithinase/hemolysin
VVSFGDSLSDLGTYTVATQVPGINPPLYFGGKFTTNFNTGAARSTVWVENLAASLGLAITPAEAGFAGQSLKCPAGVACTGYAQGGARITDPIGIGHPVGALTVPVKTQIANHLAAAGSFKATDLVFVWAGGNDLFNVMERDPAINPNSFVVRLGTIQAQLAGGLITPDQARGLGFEAQVQGQAQMKQAAQELAGYIRNEILADPASTPDGKAAAALDPSGTIGAALTTFADTFNLWLRDGLAGQPVLWVDMNGHFKRVIASPSGYGITNVSQAACDPAKLSLVTGGQVSDGTALFCSAMPIPQINGIRDGADINTWLFADGTHPSTAGHKLLSDEMLAQLRAAGWL